MVVNLLLRVTSPLRSHFCHIEHVLPYGCEKHLVGEVVLQFLLPLRVELALLHPLGFENRRIHPGRQHLNRVVDSVST